MNAIFDAVAFAATRGILGKGREADLAPYDVGLCRMVNGNLKEPYAATTIEADNVADALRSAKEWAAVVEGTGGSWLEVRHIGKVIKIFEPGEL